MKFLFLFLLHFLSNQPEEVDLGHPAIQAVCQVKLKNGKSKEGFISLAGWAYGWKYQANGFCQKYAKSDAVYLYQFSLKDDSGGVPKFKVAEGVEYYYLKNLAIGEVGFSIELLENDKIRRRTDEQFELQKSFPIYQDLPIHLFVIDGDESTEQIPVEIIDVDSIANFTLLHEPSEYWLKK